MHLLVFHFSNLGFEGSVGQLDRTSRKEVSFTVSPFLVRCLGEKRMLVCGVWGC